MYLYEMGMDAQQVNEATGGIDTTKPARGLDTTQMKSDELISAFKSKFGDEMVEVGTRQSFRDGKVNDGD